MSLRHVHELVTERDDHRAHVAVLEKVIADKNRTIELLVQELRKARARVVELEAKEVSP